MSNDGEQLTNGSQANIDVCTYPGPEHVAHVYIILPANLRGSFHVRLRWNSIQLPAIRSVHFGQGAPSDPAMEAIIAQGSARLRTLCSQLLLSGVEHVMMMPKLIVITVADMCNIPDLANEVEGALRNYFGDQLFCRTIHSLVDDLPMPYDWPGATH